MSLFRIVKDKADFVTFDRTFLADKTLDLRARGLLAWLLQYPHKACLALRQLNQQLPDSKKHIDRALCALRNAGYIQYAPNSSDCSCEFIEYRVYEHRQTLLTTREANLGTEVLADNNKSKPDKRQKFRVSSKIQLFSLHKITDKLSLEQKIFIQQAGHELHHTYKHASQSAWQQALERAILDKTFLTRMHSDFFKKLKGIKEKLATGGVSTLFESFYKINDAEQIKKCTC